MQKKFLSVRLVQNSDEVRYTELNIYIYISYVNGEECWPKILSAALNVLVNWKGKKSPPAQQYKSSKGIYLTTKVNTGGFRSACYNCGKSRHMARDYPETMKEEGREYGQSGEEAQI